MRQIYLLANGITTKNGMINFLKIFRNEMPNKKHILLITLPKYKLENSLICVCKKAGFAEHNITIFSNENCLGNCYDYVYVTEGNAFEILDFMKKYKLLEYIRKAFFIHNIDYIGASAGAMIAGIDIRLAMDFDKSNIKMTDYKALGLFNGTIIPHYKPSDLKRYLANIDPTITSRYNKIFSVANNKMLILSIQL